ncbi:hypothetical protein ACFQ08_33530, partial [Streptosporangium algeriense]
MPTPDTVRPTFITATCVLAVCLDCATPFGYDDSDIHFATLQAARRALEESGWSRARDAEPPGLDVPADVERWRCRDCTAVRACAAFGHQPYTPQPWFDPHTGVHFQGGQICERCSACLAKPIRQDPPADYPVPNPLARHLYWDRVGLPEGADLATAVAVLIDQANTVGQLERWDAYLTAHPDAALRDR